MSIITVTACHRDPLLCAGMTMKRASSELLNVADNRSIKLDVSEVKDQCRCCTPEE